MSKFFAWFFGLFSPKPQGGTTTSPTPPASTSPPTSTSSSSAASPVSVAPIPGPLYVLDVSHFQNALDYLLVKALKVVMVIAKASDGLSSLADDMYATHRKTAEAANLWFASYHFFRCDHTAEEQFATFTKVVGDLKSGEGIAVDVEWDNKSSDMGYHDGDHDGTRQTMDDKAADSLYKLLLMLKVRYPKAKIILYFNPYYFVGFKAPERFAEFIPWISAYHTTLDKVKIPKPFTTLKGGFWQFTPTVAVGKVNNIDGNWFEGSSDQLRALLQP